jgi:hypothetical protein
LATKEHKILVFVLFTFYWRQKSKNKRTTNIFVFVLFTFFWRQISNTGALTATWQIGQKTKILLFLEASSFKASSSKRVPQSEFLKASSSM